MFNKAEKIWIIQNFKEERGYTQLRRDFIHHYKIINKRTVPLVQNFLKVVKKFSSTGATHDLRVNNKGEGIEEEQVTRIKNRFLSNPTHSLRVASRELDIPFNTIHKSLKKSHFKPCKPKHVHILSEHDKVRRKSACQRFMATLQEEGDKWAKRIIFSYKKWFYLIQSSNRKNNVYRSMENPHILDMPGRS